MAGERPSASTFRGSAKDITINELLVAYWGYANEYFRKGDMVTQAHHIKAALKPLKGLYGHTIDRPRETSIPPDNAPMKQAKGKKFLELSDQEKAETVREFDQEFIADTFRPMTVTERARWQRIKRKPGRPRQGKGHKVIAVSVEKELLKQSDALAKRLGITRAALIARGLQGVLTAAKR